MGTNHEKSGLSPASEQANLKLPHMDRGDRDRRFRTFSGQLDNLGPELQLRGHASQGDDFVRILTKLTSDVERFDSMVVHHREVLEQLAEAISARDDDELSRRSERITIEAADMVATARQALEELRRLGEATKPPALTVRNRARGMAKDRRQD
jgi:hypothetical protein